MSQRRYSRYLAIVLGLSVLMLAVPSVGQTPPTYLSTSFTSGGMKQTVLSGYSGVLLNYTNTLSSPLTALIYMDVLNSAGQVAGVNVATCNFASNQTVRCFVVFPSSVPSGNYSVEVFATTASGVPVSGTLTAPVAI